MNWTRRDVEDRLREALITLRRVPAKGLRPSQQWTAPWEIIRSYAEAYGYTEERRPRLQATAQDIREMDEALSWIAAWLAAKPAASVGLPPDIAHIVWWRTANVPWARIVDLRLETWGVPAMKRGGESAIPFGNSYPTLTKAYRRAIDVIADRLNGIAAEAEAAENRPPPMEITVVGRPVEESKVVMQEGRPMVRTTHYRASWVTRPKRNRQP